MEGTFEHCVYQIGILHKQHVKGEEERKIRIKRGERKREGVDALLF